MRLVLQKLQPSLHLLAVEPLVSQTAADLQSKGGVQIAKGSESGALLTARLLRVAGLDAPTHMIRQTMPLHNTTSFGTPISLQCIGSNQWARCSAAACCCLYTST